MESGSSVATLSSARIAATLLLIAAGLAGCGQKGPLTLPDAVRAASGAAGSGAASAPTAK